MYTVTAMIDGPFLSETQVALAGIRQDGEDELLGPHRGGDLTRGPDRGPRGDAGEDALLACEPARPRRRVLVLYGDDAIDDRAIQNARDEGGADALDPVRSRRTSGEHRRLRRLDGDEDDSRNLLLEHLADAGQRAAGSDAGDERVQAASHGAQDLQRGRATVDGGIRGVLKLLRHEIAGMLAHQLFGRENGARHSLDGGREMD